MLIALAFIPPVDIVRAFEELEEYVDPTLELVLEYLEDNYIGRRQRQGRKNPRFPITLWNVYNRTLNNEPRTNNSAEAGHRRFQAELNSSHPSIRRFIDNLRRAQKARDVDYTQLEAGSEPTAKRAKYLYKVRLKAKKNCFGLCE